MTQQIAAELHALETMKTGALRDKYREVFRADTQSNNAAYLRKRIAWRIQSLAEGSLSTKARGRAGELANEADLRQRAPMEHATKATIKSAAFVPPRDPRLPQAGTIISRSFRGQNIEVTVLDDGFSFENRHYKNLSSIATEATGSRWNGFVFFGLNRKEKA